MPFHMETFPRERFDFSFFAFRMALNILLNDEKMETKKITKPYSRRCFAAYIIRFIEYQICFVPLRSREQFRLRDNVHSSASQPINLMLQSRHIFSLISLAVLPAGGNLRCFIVDFLFIIIRSDFSFADRKSCEIKGELFKDDRMWTTQSIRTTPTTLVYIIYIIYFSSQLLSRVADCIYFLFCISSPVNFHVTKVALESL